MNRAALATVLVSGPAGGHLGLSWIVDHVHGTVEARRDREDGEWRTVTIHQRGQVLSMLAFPDVQIAVGEILPPASGAD